MTPTPASPRRLPKLFRTPPSHKPTCGPDDPPGVEYARSWGALGVLGALALTAAARAGWRGWATLAALSAGTALYAGLIEPRRPRLERVDVALPGLPSGLDGMRIGLIADSHVGLPYGERNLRWAVGMMQREQPDLLLFSGDFTSTYTALEYLPDLLGGLHAPLGMFAVPGNHDYWEGLGDLERQLAPLGIQLLRNEHRLLRRNGDSFWLAGLDDIWQGRPDLDATLDGIPAGACTLMLCHAPDAADDVAARGVALQLSGHTHGGHLRLPWIGPFALPRHGLAYAMGRYTVQQMALYVSRGLGGLPFRLLCRPETTILTLRHQP